MNYPTLLNPSKLHYSWPGEPQGNPGLFIIYYLLFIIYYLLFINYYLLLLYSPLALILLPPLQTGQPNGLHTFSLAFNVFMFFHPTHYQLDPNERNPTELT